VVDPLTEYAARTSPYAYGYDNPVRFTDPTGMAREDSHQDGWGADGKWYPYKYGGNDDIGLGEYGAGDFASLQNSGPGPGNPTAKQDATSRGNESVNKAKMQAELKKGAEVKNAKLEFLKILLNASRVLDYSDLAYKMSTTNFQYSNLNLGDGLKAANVAGGVGNIIVAVEEQNKDAFFKEAAKLGIAISKYGDGFAVLSIGYDLLNLVGMDKMGAAALEMKAQSQSLYMQAMSLNYNSPDQRELRDQLINKAASIENEAIRMANKVLPKR
jgi:hypothetical protein